MARRSYFYVLDQRATLYCFNSASSLKQLSMGRHIALLGHISLITNQSLLLNLNTVCLVAKKLQKNIKYHLLELSKNTKKHVQEKIPIIYYL